MPDIITCTRRLQFCAGHRVMGHENKCAHMHGHNYVVHLTAQLTGLTQKVTNLMRPGVDEAVDKIGRVVDFSVLKYKIGKWIEKNWDHGFILHDKDEVAFAVLNTFSGRRWEEEGRPKDTPAAVFQKLFRMPYNPTAENMARYLGEVVAPIVLADEKGLEIVKVRVLETENCSATWQRDKN